MTRTKVVRALRNGIANNRAQVEKLLIKIAPTLLIQHPPAKASANDEIPLLTTIHKQLNSENALARTN